MKTFLIHVFLLLLWSMVEVSANTVITVQATNAPANAAISIISINYYLDNTPSQTSKLDATGVGTLDVIISNERFVYVDIGFRAVKLLVKPNKQYRILYDYTNKENIRFEGEDAAIQLFLEQSNEFINNFTFNNKTFMKWENLQEFPQGITALQTKLFEKFHTFCKTNSLSSTDSTILGDYFQLDLSTIVLSRYAASFDAFYKDWTGEIPDFYKNTLKNTPLNDNYFERAYYAYPLQLYFYSAIQTGNELYKRIGTWEQYKKVFPENYSEKIYADKMEIIEQDTTISPKSKEYVLADLLIHIGKFATLDSLFSNFKKKYPTSEYSAYLEKKLQKLKTLETKAYFPSIQCHDLKGKLVQFNQFKGKYLYVDVWATWCGPCIQAIPHSFKLQQKLKEHSDLVFVNLSVDTNREKWKSFVAKNPNFTGVHLNIDEVETKKLSDFFMLQGVPRYILVNKEGKILSADATYPSDPKLLKELEDLIGEK